MIPPDAAKALSILWMVFGLFLLLLTGVGLWWALRSGQFRHQDHARYLPLEAYIPEDDEPQEKTDV